MKGNTVCSCICTYCNASLPARDRGIGSTSPSSTLIDTSFKPTVSGSTCSPFQYFLLKQKQHESRPPRESINKNELKIIPSGTKNTLNTAGLIR